MLPTKCKYSDKEQASQAAKWGLEAVEDMFMWETFQYEAELKAKGLPINLSPLEAAMALAKHEEAKPLHLSPVSVYKLSYLILKKYTYFLCRLLMIHLSFLNCTFSVSTDYCLLCSSFYSPKTRGFHLWFHRVLIILMGTSKFSVQSSALYCVMEKHTSGL